MRVFVWKSYGEIDVHAADSFAQKENLKKQIVSVMKSYAQYEISEDASWQEILDVIQDEIESRSDAFEYGTGFKIIKE